MDAVRTFLDKTRWLGNAGFLIRDHLTLYIDPIGLGEKPPTADIILLTHDHPEHCSIKDVLKASCPQTIVVGPAAAVSRFRLNQLPLHGGETKVVLGVPVTATVAYAPLSPTHPRGGPSLGFLFEMLGLRILHAGDTSAVPELEGLKADVALLPVAGHLMEPSDAARLAKDLGSLLALPMHYDAESEERAELFIREARALGLNAELPTRDA